MADEVWRPIPLTEGYYGASNLGRIRSLYSGQPRVLKVLSNPLHQYLQVTLVVGGKKYARRVHKLVATAFYGLPTEGQVVRHLDGNRLNNLLENLCFGTYAENAADRVAHGNDRHTNKTHCPHGHPYDAENTGIQRRKDGSLSGRFCRTCHRSRNSAYQRRKAAA